MSRLGSPDGFIRPRPMVSPRVLAGRRPRLPPPLDAPGVTFHARARDAIWRAVKALAPGPEDTVLLPSYNCGAEVDAVLNAPARVRFYRVDADARLDMAHLCGSIDAHTRAVLLTHYFGFAEPALPTVVDLCRAHGLTLIEDCAHALLSTADGRPLGTSGDIAVFSLWKTLPVPDGAAACSNGRLVVPTGTARPPLFDSLNWVRLSARSRRAARARRGCSSAARRAVRRALASSSRSALPAGANPHVSFDAGTAEWTISVPALLIAARSDHAAIAAQRRRNYAHLARELADVSRLRLLRPELDTGACPLALPVVTREADSLHKHLRRAAIGAELFWSDFHPSFPANEFPDATFLKRHVVALPVHQDLGAAAMRRIAAVVQGWSAGSSSAPDSASRFGGGP